MLPRGVCAILEREDRMDEDEDMTNPIDLEDTSPIMDWRKPIQAYIAYGEEPDDKW